MPDFSTNKHIKSIASIAVSALLYGYVAYALDRTNFLILFSVFTVLFGIYILIYQQFKNSPFKVIFFLGIAFRLIFLFAEPTLSDDVFRFIWDGRLMAAGIHPFEYLPSELIHMDMHIPGITQDLYDKLNSKNYYSIYPPFNQAIFYLSTILNVHNLWISTVMLHIFVLSAEVLSLFMINALTIDRDQKQKALVLYAFNPLVIIELSGNLHFEAFMIAFILLAVYFLLKQKILPAAVFWSLAIATKLWPLMFLPFLFGHLKIKTLLIFYALTGIITVVIFGVYYDLEAVRNILQSADLYFRNFEFNASIYYLLRELGVMVYGYNNIALIGPVLAIISALSIFLLAFLHRKGDINQIWQGLCMGFFIFLLLSTTVHPWYVAPLLIFGLLSGYWFPLLWSFTAMFSYYAYGQLNWQENYWLIYLEYAFVFSMAIYEFSIRGATPTSAD